jgi:hypothetical protein
VQASTLDVVYIPPMAALGLKKYPIGAASRVKMKADIQRLSMVA